MTDSNPIEIQSVQNNVSPRKRSRRVGAMILLGILMLLIIAGMSAYGGYRTAVDWRFNSQGTRAAQALETQFALAAADIDMGNLGLARQRLEWFGQQSKANRGMSDALAVELQVQFQLAQQDLQEKRYAAAEMRVQWILEWNSDFPGAAALLSDALYYQRITATPTVAPTTVSTPTPDLRPIEKIFTDAQQALNAGRWSEAIESLLSLRKQDPNYQAIRVDGMLYIALSHRGIDKIQGNGKTDATITRVDLEGGMYDLSQAEQFGVLDTEAKKWSQWAEWYVTGASYWKVNWPQAVSLFELVSSVAPYLSDGSGNYAINRYHEALIGYGDSLAGQGDWCAANEQYQKALTVGADTAIQPTADYASSQCNPSAGFTPTPHPPVDQPTATLEVPAATPSDTPPVPSETPTP
jgi:tetratricopeptide (TPR) repeat protein